MYMCVLLHNSASGYLELRRNIYGTMYGLKHTIIVSIDSISRDVPDSPLTQYITNAGISRVRYTITHFKHYHRVLRLISNRISVQRRYIAQVYLRTARSKKSPFGIFFLILLLLLSSVDLAQ